MGFHDLSLTLNFKRDPYSRRDSKRDSCTSCCNISNISRPKYEMLSRPLPRVSLKERIYVSKVQSCKLYNKYMITSTQITNTEILTFIAALVFKLLSR